MGQCVQVEIIESEDELEGGNPGEAMDMEVELLKVLEEINQYGGSEESRGQHIKFVQGGALVLVPSFSVVGRCMASFFLPEVDLGVIVIEHRAAPVQGWARPQLQRPPLMLRARKMVLQARWPNNESISMRQCACVGWSWSSVEPRFSTYFSARLTSCRRGHGRDPTLCSSTGRV